MEGLIDGRDIGADLALEVLRQMRAKATEMGLALSGVVTDRGGMLSHAAIVAREFGKPAVTGTCDATVRMVSGNKYRIDGTVGKVVSL